jgi:hypothetical protein
LFSLFFTGINDTTSGKLTTGVIDNSGKFAIGVIETCGKFSTDVIATSGAP